MRPLWITAAGVVAVVAGLFLWFGPPALVACGLVLIVVGLLVPEEALTDDQPPHPPTPTP